MLEVSIRFDLLENILEMTFGHAQLTSKKTWSKLVWDRARNLDDIYWRSTTVLHGKLDILVATISVPHYLTWWYIADNAPVWQAMCEIMARLTCHASQLKDDDPRYKGSSLNHKMCRECDLGMWSQLNT